MFGKGISKEGDILDLAVKENIVEKAVHGLHTAVPRLVRDGKMQNSIC